MMLRIIKTTKEMRLDELIKHVIENSLNSFQFTSDNNVDVYFSSNGHFTIAGDSNGNGRSIELADTFTVEVEEEITEDTVFRELVISDGQKTSIAWNCSIRDCEHTSNQKFYTHVGGILELIWEADSE